MSDRTSTSLARTSRRTARLPLDPVVFEADDVGMHDAQQTDRQFFDALLTADANALRRLLHPDFVIVDVQAGDVTRRDEFVAFVESRQVTFADIELHPEDAVVRTFGDCVVVVGRTRMSFSMPDGTEVITGSRYTHVFVRDGQDGAWQLVSAQGTQLPDC